MADVFFRRIIKSNQSDKMEWEFLLGFGEIHAFKIRVTYTQ